MTWTKALYVLSCMYDTGNGQSSPCSGGSGYLSGHLPYVQCCITINVLSVLLNKTHPFLPVSKSCAGVVEGIWPRQPHSHCLMQDSPNQIQNGCPFPSAASDVVMATVTAARRLTTQDAVKKTLLLTLDTKVTFRQLHRWNLICHGCR